MKEETRCARCQAKDNPAGMFVWLFADADIRPHCPGRCTNAHLADMRAQGLHLEAATLQLDIEAQLAGGWKENVRLLEQHPRPHH